MPVKIIITDIPNSPKEFFIHVECDPPLEEGKLPDTASGKIAAIILQAMANYKDLKMRSN